ncbi:hypothetical protein ACIRPX_35885 [Streptomyces sp. NPDC101225]|uniref:hypothetical protein n=1 Tax=Streptomyces sp. NPDC101225 TaxID=3366135 RepID=UPI003805B8FC
MFLSSVGRALTHAAAVTVAALAVQLITGLAMLWASGQGMADLADFIDASSLLFPLCAVLVVAAARLMWPVQKRLAAAATDAGVYTAVLWAVVTVTSLQDENVAGSVENGFFVIGFALIGLQIPAAFAASALLVPRTVQPLAWSQAPLEPAVTRH